jgi:hypothetical protein
MVTAHAYQGGHVDIHVESDAARSGRILVRDQGSDAIQRWAVGARVALACAGANAVAFPET